MGSDLGAESAVIKCIINLVYIIPDYIKVIYAVQHKLITQVCVYVQLVAIFCNYHSVPLFLIRKTKGNSVITVLFELIRGYI